MRWPGLRRSRHCARFTERGRTRADDRASEAAMEDRKKEGYF
jgi:sulfate adenylyltransferase subunit 2